MLRGSNSIYGVLYLWMRLCLTTSVNNVHNDSKVPKCKAMMCVEVMCIRISKVM